MARREAKTEEALKLKAGGPASLTEQQRDAVSIQGEYKDHPLRLSSDYNMCIPTLNTHSTQTHKNSYYPHPTTPLVGLALSTC